MAEEKRTVLFAGQAGDQAISIYPDDKGAVRATDRP